MTLKLDPTDAALLDELQTGLPLESRPYLSIGKKLGLPENEVVSRLRRLLEAGAINRIGPVLSATAMGGKRMLAAMSVPPDRLEEVASYVNGFPAVSHNYEREHHYNLWFVISSADPAEVDAALYAIRKRTRLPVMELPALEEYFLGVRFELA
ncbi:MAG: AsnC family transcriptional regulator [Dehalococcoidia bacterium]|nr:AsnC family transcriptional regulator [Dehalococcoidia bacterium]